MTTKAKVLQALDEGPCRWEELIVRVLRDKYPPWALDAVKSHWKPPEIEGYEETEQVVRDLCHAYEIFVTWDRDRKLRRHARHVAASRDAQEAGLPQDQRDPA